VSARKHWIYSPRDTAPRVPEDVLERERVRVITGLREADTKPDHIASRTLRKMLYGSHPYGLRGSGEIASLELLQRKDLVDLYQSAIVPPVRWCRSWAM